ncbi:MAG: hypothetical protein R3C18_08345 [Planctomycetaceae bacterium]
MAHIDDKFDGKIRRGRRERRTLLTRTFPCRDLDWPGARQVVMYVRLVDCQGKTTRQVHYAITNLPRHAASAHDLLTWRRGCWGIENRTFYVRDVAYREDHSQIRLGQLPRVMASVRNAAIDFLRALGAQNVTAALRENALRLDRLPTKLGILKN